MMHRDLIVEVIRAIPGWTNILVGTQLKYLRSFKGDLYAFEAPFSSEVVLLTEKEFHHIKCAPSSIQVRNMVDA